MVRRMMPLRFREDDQHGSSTRLGDGDRWSKIPLPEVRVAAEAERSLAVQLYAPVEHIRDARRVPGVQLPVAEDDVSSLRKWSPHAAWYAES